MAITTLPAAPQRTDPPALYVTKADAMMAALPQLVTDINATTANLSTIAAGGAFSIPYLVDLSSTADTDPGNGRLRFNSVTQNTATTLRLDLLGVDGVDYTNVIDAFDSGTSFQKGTIKLTKLGDSTKYVMYNVLARSVQTGFRDITVTAFAYSSQNPFGVGDNIVLTFQRTGDKGDVGAQYVTYSMYVRDEKTSGTVGGPNSSFLSTWLARTLNTVKVNTISGASLSSNQVTLPAGTYEYVGTAPGYMCGAHQVRLYNVTDFTTMDVGTSEFSYAGDSTQTRSIVRGQFTISATKVFNLSHFTTASNGGTSAYGSAASTGSIEVYAELWIKKVA